MSYVQTTPAPRPTAAVKRVKSGRMVKSPGLGSIGSLVNSATSTAAASSPIGIIGSVLSIFGGSDRNQKIPQHKAMIQQMYNGALMGDVSYAQKLLWCITGDYNENKPFASALWNQLKTTAPKVYAAAQAAGAWPQPKGVDIDINTPPVPNASLTGTSTGVGAALSSLTGGASSSALLIPALLLGGVFLATRK